MLDRVLNSRYEVQQLLGQKAGTTTILARDSQSGRLTIVRLSFFPNDVDREIIHRIYNKVEILQSLSHPSLPKILDIFEVDSPRGKGVAIVRPYLPLKSLEHYIHSIRSLSEPEIQQIAKYCLEILSYLHERTLPIFHGNLKLGNIFFEPRQDRIYLVDFGFDFGSPRLDLYHLGTVLIGLATGISPKELPRKNGRIQFERKTNLSSFFLYWLKRAIETDPERGFRSVKEALESLYSYQLILTPRGNIIKPYGSEVGLFKSDHLIQVTIASKAKQRFLNNLHYQFHRFLPSIVFSVPLLTIVGVYRLKLLAFLVPVILLFTLDLFSSSLSFELLKAFSIGELELWISPEKIALSRYIFWIKTPLLPSASSFDIQRIERRNVAVTIQFDRPKIIPSCLALVTPTREYTISASPDIGEAELDWLAHQIGDWLGLPIARV
jgi:serine/threonine protein kinase